MSDQKITVSALNEISRRYAADVTAQLNLTGPLFSRPRTGPILGPRTPSVTTEAFTLKLQDGEVFAQGHGWESESGYVTQDEARDIIEFLTRYALGVKSDV